MDHAVPAEGGLDIEYPVGAVHIAAAHVLQAVLDEPDRHVQAAREIADENGVLDAALHAVAASDIHVVVDANGIAGQPQRARRLVRILRHLDRRPELEYLLSRVPLRGDPEGLDRYRRAASPNDA